MRPRPASARADRAPSSRSTPDAQAEHRVLTEDVRSCRRPTARRVLDGERKVVAAFADAIAAARPELRAHELDKPLTMLLFGMMNWMFTWLQPRRRAQPRRHGAGRRRPVLRRPRRGARARRASPFPFRTYTTETPHASPRQARRRDRPRRRGHARQRRHQRRRHRLGHRPGRLARHPGEEHDRADAADDRRPEGQLHRARRRLRHHDRGRQHAQADHREQGRHRARLDRRRRTRWR